jgi:hypothetical protein
MVSIQFSKNAEMILGQRRKARRFGELLAAPIRESLLQLRHEMSVMGVREICDEKSRWIEGPAWWRNTVLSAIA